LKKQRNKGSVIHEIDAIDSSIISSNSRVEGCSALIMHLPRLRGATCMTLGGTDKKGGSWDRLSWHHAATFQCNHRRFAPYAAAVFSLIVYLHLEIVNFCPSSSEIGARYVLSFSMSFNIRVHPVEFPISLSVNV